jgi:hypothetical protein
MLESMNEETAAERLTIISEVEWLHFEPPMLVHPGEYYWVENRTLHVRSVDGQVRKVAARAPRPTDRR